MKNGSVVIIKMGGIVGPLILIMKHSKFGQAPKVEDSRV